MAAQEHQARGGGTVTVACKYPPGLILRMMKQVDKRETSPMGTREFKQWEPAPEIEPIVIAGPGGVPFGLGVRLGGPIITADGFALTSGVPKDFWDEWARQNEDSELIKNKLLFARATDVESVARENGKAVTGLEPTDPDNPSKRIGRLRGLQVTRDDGK